ncbi:disease resistance protein RPM1-like isoform X1 [Oryza glaberrima]|uniref:disease resistance protein RPM1-like isoform X1 n=1 Tax=Oryza glaberrima TaxID=4538 RepID=UPI00224C10D7|nr:disease resistance protein RPM1-like isoform X1 [Oryza glaberrima]XP_052168826.1 disease resistance protein RPM1-like isoform X1 [Oryza glaberrima]XP_052168827.1 disease resistance protein RPM1-like isoform X1 [Oryza glaberrima]
MAEIAVLFVIKKIGIAVAGDTLKLAIPLFAKKTELKKVELVTALPVNMRQIKKELEIINAFLKELGMNGYKGEVVETWIRQVRRLAHDMEDVVDEFMYVVGKNKHKKSWACVKKIIKKPKPLFSLDEIATKADMINTELAELSKRLDRWTRPLSSGIYVPPTNYNSEQQLYLPGYDYSINDNELVGIDKNRQTLIESLRLEDCSLRIIAVWGMGGLGKSTLVNDIYKNEAIVSNFNCHAWLCISQSSKMHDIWQNMLKELCGEDNRGVDAENMNNRELRLELAKILRQKRYLIILDDVWLAADLLKIREVLVDNGLGSRVIITTRIEEVASIAEDGCKIRLEPLNNHDAWLLFCRKAFPKTENHMCPPELHQCGMDIVNKCGGLPLALVTIGSLLSLKPRNKKEWRLFYNQLISEVHNNENLNRVEKILNLSYKHLPNYLKNCFLYCAMFPEDYIIQRKRLIRLWIAEGFIEQKGTCSLEDVAEGYLTELVRRSMIQVVARNSFNRIQCLRMHDILRELAIFQSKKESFSTVYDDTHGVVQVGSDSRRVSVLQCNSEIRSTVDPSRLRTFLAFDTSMALSSASYFIFSESKYLAVLELSGLPIETIPYSVGELFNLRYLCLNDTNVKEFPKSITKLLNLQTLSLERTQLLNFPRGFSNLKKLRHLLVWKLVDATYKSLNNWESLEPFEGLWNLKELQSLCEVRATRDFVSKLGNLSQLRSLCITYVRSSHCAQLCNSLSKMQHLTRLHIRAMNEDEVLLLDDLMLPNPLEKLDLLGQLSKGTLESPFFTTHGNELLQLELSRCQLTVNLVAWLSKLSNLTELRLTRVYTGQQLSFHANCFPNLKKALLWDLQQVNQIYIQEGALSSLQYLHIDSLMELRDVPTGIEFLRSVKEAYFTMMHSDFVRNLRTGKVNHIPKVYWSTQGVSAEPANLPGESSTNPQWRMLGGSGWVFI